MIAEVNASFLTFLSCSSLIIFTALTIDSKASIYFSIFYKNQLLTQGFLTFNGENLLRIGHFNRNTQRITSLFYVNIDQQAVTHYLCLQK